MVDGKPPCFAHSRLDLSVQYGSNGNGPIYGGFSEDPTEVSYRCMGCPHMLECQSKAEATYPQDYQKSGDPNQPMYVRPRQVAQAH
jgi:hypothetical protein